MTSHFFDIGANVAQSFDWTETQQPDYRHHLWTLFEPSPRHFAALLAKVSEQAKRGYKIRVCPFGLAGRNGIVPLYEKDDAMGDSLHAWTKSDHVPENREQPYEVIAATRSLSAAILDLTLPGDTVVLDIDAEGAEYDMLLNLGAVPAALRRVVRILCEFHYVKGRDCPEMKTELMKYYAAKGLLIEARGFVP